MPSAVDFRYFAPKTKLAAKGDFILVSCKSAAELRVAPTLSIVQSGVADPKAEFKLLGDNLMSAIQKREVTLELSETGTLKSLNTSSSDRTGAVVTNVLKIFSTVAGAIVGGAAPGAGFKTEAASPCNPDTQKALDQAVKLAIEIRGRRDTLLSASPDEAVKLGKQIDVMATQLAGLTMGPLSVSVARPLEIGDRAAKNVPIKWTLGELSKWFATDPKAEPCKPQRADAFDNAKTGCLAETDILSMIYAIEGTPEAETPSKSKCRLDYTPPAGETKPAACARSLVLVRPVTATVTLTAANANYLGSVAGGELGSAKAPISQWGEAQYLALDVNRGQSRAVGMTFDQFGRKQTLKWTSDATAENVTGALADIADAGAKAVKAVKGEDEPSEVDAMKAEADEIETRTRLMKAKACQAIDAVGLPVCIPTVP